MVATYIYIYHHIINGYHIYITINNSHPIRLRMTTAIPKKPTASRGAARRVRLLVDFPPGLLRGPGHHSKPLEAAGHHSNREEMKPLENQQTAGKVFEIPRFWLHFETFVCSCSKGSNLAVWEAAPPKDGRLVKAWRSALLADLKMGDLAPKKSISRDLRWLNMIKPSATGISMDFPELNETLEMGLSENAGFRPQLMPRLMGENDAMPMDWGVLYFQTKPHMITY